MDLTARDGVFEILIVRGIRAVVLVTSGNSTFEAGLAGSSRLASASGDGSQERHPSALTGTQPRNSEQSAFAPLNLAPATARQTSPDSGSLPFDWLAEVGDSPG